MFVNFSMKKFLTTLLPLILFLSFTSDLNAQEVKEKSGYDIWEATIGKRYNLNQEKKPVKTILDLPSLNKNNTSSSLIKSPISESVLSTSIISPTPTLNCFDLYLTIT